jgi:hypothetical protein
VVRNYNSCNDRLAKSAGRAAIQSSLGSGGNLTK